MAKNILLIGDTVSACRVALSAMEPVLTFYGYTVSTLPTAIVSNTFGYRKVAQVSTGDYVAQSLAAWDEMGFDFECIYVGYITERAQAQAVAAYCHRAADRGVLIFHDPVMGEDGHLYYGMDEKNAALHREIIPHTAYIMPSYTEAAFLAGMDYTAKPAETDIWHAAQALARLGAKNIVMTSCLTEKGDYTACIDAQGSRALLACDHIPVKVAGTGDLFSAFFMAEILSGTALQAAARKAMDSVRILVDLSRNDNDTLRGVHLARHLNKLK